MSKILVIRLCLLSATMRFAQAEYQKTIFLKEEKNLLENSEEPGEEPTALS